MSENKKKVLEMSSTERAQHFSRMAEEQAALDAMPKVFQEGEYLHEVVTEDLGFEENDG